MAVGWVWHLMRMSYGVIIHPADDDIKRCHHYSPVPVYVHQLMALILYYQGGIII